MTTFPIDLKAYKPLTLDVSSPTLTAEQRDALKANIQLCRDSIVFFNATGAARGVGSHIGSFYETVPEVMILDALFRGSPDKFAPVFFDEAGHRCATHSLMSSLEGTLPAEPLLISYHAANSILPGHPELVFNFNAGHLDSMWPSVNRVVFANPEQTDFYLGSDGSKQEGNVAEVASLALSQHINIKLLIDNNGVAIAGKPYKYLPGFSVKKTLQRYCLKVLEGDGEEIDGLYTLICKAIKTYSPIAVVNKRAMCIGIERTEGSKHSHNLSSLDAAINYFEVRGHIAVVKILRSIVKPNGTTPLSVPQRSITPSAAAASLSMPWCKFSAA